MKRYDILEGDGAPQSLGPHRITMSHLVVKFIQLMSRTGRWTEITRRIRQISTFCSIHLSSASRFPHPNSGRTRSFRRLAIRSPTGSKSAYLWLTYPTCINPKPLNLFSWKCIWNTSKWEPVAKGTRGRVLRTHRHYMGLLGRLVRDNLSSWVSGHLVLHKGDGGAKEDVECNPTVWLETLLAPPSSPTLTSIGSTNSAIGGPLMAPHQMKSKTLFP